MPPVANVVISNVPGPQVPLYASGARMATYWPLSIPEHGVGLNLTVMSYAGAMGFGFTTARSAVPDARELTTALAGGAGRTGGAHPGGGAAQASTTTEGGQCQKGRESHKTRAVRDRIGAGRERPHPARRRSEAVGQRDDT
jgi:hypothetical protein